MTCTKKRGNDVSVLENAVVGRRGGMTDETGGKRVQEHRRTEGRRAIELL